jgi:hypothetical protein
MINTIANSTIRQIYPTLWRTLIFLLKAAHSVVFLSFVFSDIIILYSGITGTYGSLFYAAVVTLGTEMIVLYYNRWRCPLTKLALAMGDKTGDDLIADYLMPKKAIRWVTPTLAFFFFSGLIINLAQLLITVAA